MTEQCTRLLRILVILQGGHYLDISEKQSVP